MLSRLTRFVEKACSDGGLSLPQYRLLLLLSRQAQRASELATHAAITRPAVTDAVDGLVREGFLRRVPDENDRRAMSLELTDAGAKALDKAEASLTDKLLKLEMPARLIEDLASLREVLDEHLERRMRASMERR